MARKTTLSTRRTSRRSVLMLAGGVSSVALIGAVKLMSAPVQARDNVTLYKNPQCRDTPITSATTALR